MQRVTSALNGTGPQTEPTSGHPTLPPTDVLCLSNLDKTFGELGSVSFPELSSRVLLEKTTSGKLRPPPQPPGRSPLLTRRGAGGGWAAPLGAARPAFTDQGCGMRGERPRPAAPRPPAAPHRSPAARPEVPAAAARPPRLANRAADPGETNEVTGATSAFKRPFQTDRENRISWRPILLLGRVPPKRPRTDEVNFDRNVVPQPDTARAHTHTHTHTHAHTHRSRAALTHELTPPPTRSEVPICEPGGGSDQAAAGTWHLEPTAGTVCLSTLPPRSARGVRADTSLHTSPHTCWRPGFWLSNENQMLISWPHYSTDPTCPFAHTVLSATSLRYICIWGLNFRASGRE